MDPGKFANKARNRRVRMAAVLSALLMLAVPLAWAWHLKELANAALADPRSNPPAQGHNCQRAISCALGSGYAPAMEQPQVLLVNNPSALGSLLIAQPGDLVLVYRQSHLMLLYDPLTDRILNRAALPPGLAGS